MEAITIMPSELDLPLQSGCFVGRTRPNVYVTETANSPAMEKPSWIALKARTPSMHFNILSTIQPMLPEKLLTSSSEGNTSFVHDSWSSSTTENIQHWAVRQKKFALFLNFFKALPKVMDFLFKIWRVTILDFGVVCGSTGRCSSCVRNSLLLQNVIFLKHFTAASKWVGSTMALRKENSKVNHKNLNHGNLGQYCFPLLVFERSLTSKQHFQIPLEMPIDRTTAKTEDFHLPGYQLNFEKILTFSELASTNINLTPYPTRTVYFFETQPTTFILFNVVRRHSCRSLSKKKQDKRLTVGNVNTYLYLVGSAFTPFAPSVNN
ncbi:hypothetical protein EGR_04086 [Echinococcus granulosus]|uniref:Uncharacterized protein n=1 Tax=Echinococcus granulosus TaxID=6210 RepID=W6UJ51_ECHGR|nr:hypothetical protein EGR_04086 [Echinococcus granulosus]EUB61053.1 hypothetical protein EGR_04086 [Echinococcus granulosus]